MIQRNNQTAWGLFNGVLAGALWGMVFLAPALTTAFSALQLAVGRYLLYGAVACALLLPLWPALRAQVDRRAWLALAGLSLLGNLVYFVFLAMAVHSATARARRAMLARTSVSGCWACSARWPRWPPGVATRSPMWCGCGAIRTCPGMPGRC